MTSRRHFMAGMALASLAPSLTWAAVGNPVAITAAMAADGTFLIIGLSTAGEVVFRQPLPTRGHAAAAHPNLAEAVAIARRPSTFAKVIDCATGAMRQTLAAPGNHHFYGQAAFSSNGAILFTTEQDIASGEGRIGVWARAEGYKRIDEFASGGIGQPEILTLPSGNLAVAKGGIRTHPDTGPEKRNLDMMQPNLCGFSPSGGLIDVARVPANTHQNLLRHIQRPRMEQSFAGFNGKAAHLLRRPLSPFTMGSARLSPRSFMMTSRMGWPSTTTLFRSCSIGFTAKAARLSVTPRASRRDLQDALPRGHHG